MRKNKKAAKREYCVWTPISTEVKDLCLSECNLLSHLYKRARGNVILWKRRTCPKCGKPIKYEAFGGED